MKFVCQKCGTKYSIADERVRRKVLKIRCKNCANIIVVRERATGSHVAAAQAAGGGGPELKSIPGGAHTDADRTRITSIPEFGPEPPLLEEDWYLAVDDHQYGPMTFDELCSRVKRGEARGEGGDESYVWRDGFDDWVEVSNVPELRPYAPPPPPRRSSPHIDEHLRPVVNDPQLAPQPAGAGSGSPEGAFAASDESSHVEPLPTSGDHEPLAAALQAAAAAVAETEDAATSAPAAAADAPPEPSPDAPSPQVSAPPVAVARGQDRSTPGFPLHGRLARRLRPRRRRPFPQTRPTPRRRCEQG